MKTYKSKINSITDREFAIWNIGRIEHRFLDAKRVGDEELAYKYEKELEKSYKAISG